MQLDFITPGRPAENGTIENFSAKLRDECRNMYWWESSAGARAEIEV